MFLFVLKGGLNLVYHIKINKICIIIHKTAGRIIVANDIMLELDKTVLYPDWLGKNRIPCQKTWDTVFHQSVRIHFPEMHCFDLNFYLERKRQPK